MSFTSPSTPLLESVQSTEPILINPKAPSAPSASETIAAVASQALAFTPNISDHAVGSKKPLAKIRKSKKVLPDPFSLFPESLKMDLMQKRENFKQFVHHLQQKTDGDTQLFLVDFEKELDVFKIFAKDEVAERLAWGKDFYDNRLKDQKDLPLFFKNEFKQWLQLMEQVCSWEGVQKAIKHPIKKAHKEAVFDELLCSGSSDQERQLGQIFLTLYQADCPQFLKQRLQTADKLYARLVKQGFITKPKQKQTLRALLQELHRISDPLFSSPPIPRIKPVVSTPPYSNLDKLKKGLGLIFSAIGHFFQRQSRWTKAQETPDYLLAEHCDFSGELVGREENQRHATIHQLLASKKAQLRYLESEDPPSIFLIENLEKEIALYQKYHQDRTWVTANQLREDFSGYQNQSPECHYIPAIVNSRIHRITTETDELAIHRSGAISYLLDGSTNLIDLKAGAMEHWKEQFAADTFIEFHQKAREYLNKRWDRRLYSVLNAIEKRKQALDDQMVQYVAHQVEAHLGEIADSSRSTVTRLTRTIQLTQISLLNPLKNSKERSGLQISERNQMLDMEAIFQDFDGKQIQFSDVTAPFMVGDIIHLPLSLLKDPLGKPLSNPDITDPFTLSCTFFNTSVQGLKVNEGEQKAINQKALKQLQKNLLSIQTLLEKNPALGPQLNISLTSLQNRFEQLKERLEKGETGYALAKDLALLQHAMQGSIGFNCFSGKDRTGYLVALIVAHQLSIQIDQREDLSEMEKKALKRKLERDLMDLEIGLASKVVYQNTGHQALKIQEWLLMGINAGEGFLGDLIRLGHALFAFSAKA
jgi:hypothetical protein